VVRFNLCMRIHANSLSTMKYFWCFGHARNRFSCYQWITNTLRIGESGFLHQYKWQASWCNSKYCWKWRYDTHIHVALTQTLERFNLCMRIHANALSTMKYFWCFGHARNRFSCYQWITIFLHFRTISSGEIS
jgi:hypothetical protein